MKKIFVALVLALGFVVAASAQPRAVGLRLGYATEASYQHTVGGQNFFEVNLGTFGYTGVMASTTYNFMIANPSWTRRGEWGIYAGPGIAMGASLDYSISLVDEEHNYAYLCGNFALMGQVGLEYTFWFPLQLSVDMRPMVGITAKRDMDAGQSAGTEFYKSGLLGFVPTLSVRYRF